MTKEITKEQITKIFGLYLNCRCKVKSGSMLIANANSMDKDGNLIMSPSLLADCHEGTFWFSDFQLLLTPLEKISDADAVEVFNAYQAKELSDFLKDKEKISIVKHGIEHKAIFYKAADKLRSLGYALDYEGVNLFEAGIAIEKP